MMITEDEKTSIIVFNINDNYSIGFHECCGAPCEYYQQSAGDIYSYCVRSNKIKTMNSSLDILITNIFTELAHVVPNGDYIESWKSKLTQKDFLNANVDIIEVYHKKYNIEKYVPFKNDKLSEEVNDEMKINFYERYKFIVDKKSVNNIHNIKCLIWKELKKT